MKRQWSDGVLRFLAQEIVLVDDASTVDHVKEKLENYMGQYKKVSVLRAEGNINSS